MLWLHLLEWVVIIFVHVSEVMCLLQATSAVDGKFLAAWSTTTLIVCLNSDWLHRADPMKTWHGASVAADLTITSSMFMIVSSLYRSAWALANTGSTASLGQSQTSTIPQRPGQYSSCHSRYNTNRIPDVNLCGDSESWFLCFKKRTLSSLSCESHRCLLRIESLLVILSSNQTASFQLLLPW